MKKIFVVAIGLFLVPHMAGAQTESIRTTNALYANFLGDASLASLNFEVSWLERPHFFMSSKVGVGFNQEFQILCWNGCDAPIRFTTFPVHLTANFGGRRSFFELGAGATWLFSEYHKQFLLYPVLGYKFCPYDAGKFYFKIFTNVYPVTGEPEYILFIPLGIAGGVAF